MSVLTTSRDDSRPAVPSIDDLDSAIHLPERLGYRLKRALLGPPLVTAQLHDEKLSKKPALGVLSSDCISSSAYGTEEMLIVLLAVFGLAGFHILMPLTGGRARRADPDDAVATAKSSWSTPGPAAPTSWPGTTSGPRSPRSPRWRC